MLETFLRLGEKLYCVKRDWGYMPKRRFFNNVSGISIDDENRVYVLQRANPFVLVFSNDGYLINEWYDENINDGHYIRNLKDKVFVVDRDHHRVIMLSQSGEVLHIIGDNKRPGLLGEPFNHPTDVAMAFITGDIYVADGYGNFCVHHFSSNGKLLNSWGKAGAEPGEFLNPHSILVDKQGRVLVCDRGNNRVQAFKQNGVFIHELKLMYHPMAITEDNDGFIYVTDHTPRVMLFDSQNNLVGCCRSFGRVSHGIAVDNDGNIFCAERSPSNITKLERHNLELSAQ